MKAAGPFTEAFRLEYDANIGFSSIDQNRGDAITTASYRQFSLCLRRHDTPIGYFTTMSIGQAGPRHRRSLLIAAD